MILLAVAVLVFFPLSAYIALRFSGRRAWGVVHDGYVSQGAGVYRSVAVPTWKEGSPPFVVRATSFTSLLLGQMVVPGGLAALLGLAVVVDGGVSRSEPGLLLGLLLLSAPTGLAVGVKLLIAGQAMVRRAPGAIASTRSAARWAIWHNVALVAALAVVPFFDPAFEPRLLVVILLCCSYAALSLVHAVFLRDAASALEAYDAAQVAAPAPAAPAPAAPAPADPAVSVPSA
ncbi:hypothetical protein WME91_54990 [Sorangium sp. So ce269]